MAVRRHLGFYRNGNSAIQSADAENPSLGQNMEWIGSFGCTVFEIFAFKLYCDIETGGSGSLTRPVMNRWFAHFIIVTHITESYHSMPGGATISIVACSAPHSTYIWTPQRSPNIGDAQ